MLRNLLGNDEPKDVASNLGRKIVAKPQSSENVTLFNPNQNPGYKVAKPKPKPEYPGGKPNPSWTKEEYYRYQKWVRDQNPFTFISFAPPEHLGITKSENESKNDTIMYNKSDSTLSQLQNNPNNNQFWNTVLDNVKNGKGGSMSVGKTSELETYLLNLAEKYKSNSGFQSYYENYQDELYGKNANNIKTLNQNAARNTPSFRGQFEKNNSAVKTVSTTVGDIHIHVNLNGTNNTQRDANNIAQTLEDKLYNIFNEVQMRGI